MIDPSSVNLLSLPSVSLENRFNLPMTPGIYLAIDPVGEVKYVGRTKAYGDVGMYRDTIDTTNYLLKGIFGLLG